MASCTDYKRMTSLTLVICVSLLGLMFLPHDQTAWAQDPLVQIAQSVDLIGEKRISPSAELNVGDEAEVTITLRSMPLDGCYGIPGKPLDAVFIVDNSTSAFREGRMEQVKYAARSLITQLDQEIYASRLEPALRSQVSVIVSELVTDTIQNRLVGPHYTYEAIHDAISDLQAGTDTVLEDSIPLALEALESPRAEAKPVIFVFLHDNGAFTADGEHAVSQALQAGIDVYILAIGHSEEIDLSRATDMTGDADRVLLNPSDEKLRTTFVQASNGRGDLIALDLEVVESIDPAGAVEVFAVEPDGLVGDGNVVWDLPQISADDSVELGYWIRAREDGQLSLVSSVSYIDCNGYRHLSQIGGIEPAAVDLRVGSAPTDTPTPPPTATPTATTTPSPGSAATTPTGSGSTPQPKVSTSPADVGTQISGTISSPTPTPQSCRVRLSADRSVPCWILISLLPLLLLPLVVWLLLRKRPKSGPVTVVRPPRATEPDVQPRRIGSTPEPGGEIIAPGRAIDYSDLLAQLRQARSFQGRIPTSQTGFFRPNIQARTFCESEHIAKDDQFQLESMGQEFLWERRDGQVVSVPTTLLSQVLQELISHEQPLLAIWSKEPTDNVMIRVRIRPHPTRDLTNAQVQWLYHTPEVGAQAPMRSYFLDLRILNHPKGKVRPEVIEAEV